MRHGRLIGQRLRAKYATAANLARTNGTPDLADQPPHRKHTAAGFQRKASLSTQVPACDQCIMSSSYIMIHHNPDRDVAISGSRPESTPKLASYLAIRVEPITRGKVYYRVLRFHGSWRDDNPSALLDLASWVCGRPARPTTARPQAGIDKLLGGRALKVSAGCVRLMKRNQFARRTCLPGAWTRRRYTAIGSICTGPVLRKRRVCRLLQAAGIMLVIPGDAVA
jgi:hypothetical protein